MHDDEKQDEKPEGQVVAIERAAESGTVPDNEED